MEADDREPVPGHGASCTCDLTIRVPCRENLETVLGVDIFYFKAKKRERGKCYREKVFLLITIVRKFRLEEMLKKESMKHK